MRILVTGARDWREKTTLFEVLDEHFHEDLLIIHGAAPGADSMAARWARLRSVPEDRYPAEWDRYGRGAGPIRNQRMLDEAHPDIVLAFKQNFDWELKKGGTEDMVRRADKANLPCFITCSTGRLLVFSTLKDRR